MEIQLDCSADRRTPEQNAKLETYRQAARILRAAGINARVLLYVVTSDKSEPAGITID